jgi:pimeloyl-ACP methyl ester carboxylesterase
LIRPGFGFSERPRSRLWSADAQAELLEKAVAKLDARGAVIVGHSWGTLVAIALGMCDQSNAAALVLLSGYYFPTFRADVALMSWPALPIVGDILRYTLSPLLGRVMAPMVHRKMFAPAPVSSHFAREFPLELAVRPSQIQASAAEAALMVPAAATLEQRYTKLSVPVAIMAGDGDMIVDLARHAGR